MSNGNTLQAFLSVFVPTGDGITASPGIISGGASGAVSQTATPSMSVIIQPATWVVPGPSPTTQGAILWTPGTAVQTVGPFAAADPTNPRIDILTVHVNSAGDASTAPDVSYTITTGTPAASPVAPPTPTGDVFVRNVRVNATDTSIVNARLTGVPAIAKVRTDPTAALAPSKTAPKMNWGTVTATTDASGYITWTHGLGITPGHANVEGQSPITGSTIPCAHTSDTYTSTTIRTRWFNNGGTALASTSITFRYLVHG